MRLHWYQSKNFGDALSPRIVEKLSGESATWASLRMYFSLGEIVYHRSLVYLIRCLGVRHLIKYGLLAVHHPSVWKLMEIRSRKMAVEIGRV